MSHIGDSVHVFTANITCGALTIGVWYAPLMIASKPKTVVQVSALHGLLHDICMCHANYSCTTCKCMHHACECNAQKCYFQGKIEAAQDI